MELKNIKELIDSVSKSELSYFEIEQEGCHIKMGKNSYDFEKDEKQQFVDNSKKECVKLEEKIQDPKEDIIESAVNEIREEVIQENIAIISSPLVGTFYSSPSPDSDEFVKVGAKVKAGDVVCIIEAMKLMNEIEASEAGEIVEVLVNNGEMVEYNQPLFKVKLD